jgi:hypothetical protein
MHVFNTGMHWCVRESTMLSCASLEPRAEKEARVSRHLKRDLEQVSDRRAVLCPSELLEIVVGDNRVHSLFALLLGCQEVVFDLSQEPLQDQVRGVMSCACLEHVSTVQNLSR